MRLSFHIQLLVRFFVVPWYCFPNLINEMHAFNAIYFQIPPQWHYYILFWVDLFSVFLSKKRRKEIQK